MRSSIRAVLLWWHAAILLFTVGAFAAALYVSHRRAVLGEIDDRIATLAEAMAAAVEDDEEDGIELELAERFLDEFRRDDPAAPYFVVFDRQGAAVLLSRPALDVPFPAVPGFRIRGARRERAASGADGLSVVVGQDVSGAREEVRRFLMQLVAAGAFVLAAGLGSGWILATKVLAPIHRITATAAEISASDPGRRIDAGGTERELRQLALALNGAFDRLQQALDRQSRFTADASHELRTPVAVALASAEQALEQERQPAQYREALEAVLRSARRMKGIIDGLLALSRGDSGALELAVKPLALTELVREVALPHAIPVQGQEVRVAGDRERLRLVFQNLVSNALRYNRPGGSVTVTVEERIDEAVVTVQDDGIGIAREHLERIFERFYRVDPARSRALGGSGLGLAIARWIVEAHGGAIEVESEPGRGSRFRVRLPAGSPTG